MKITGNVLDLGRGLAVFDRLSGPQTRVAAAKAINDAAFHYRRGMQQHLRDVFDRPTPYIVSSPKVIQATPDKLEATILPTLDSRNLPSKGGKVGIDPQKILRAQALGGARRDKRSEVALRRAGILPGGYQLAIPKVPFEGTDDGRGNIKGSVIAQLISYFLASSEQGYRANMSDKRKSKLRNQQGIGSVAAKKVYKTTLGVRYFVSYGRLRGSHLAPGIWAARGTHDVDVRPVVMFVRNGAYKPRLSTERIEQQVGLGEYLARRMRFRIREAAGV